MMDSGASSVSEGQNSVVSNLKDIFNKRFAQSESDNEFVSGNQLRESRAQEKAPAPRSKNDVSEKIGRADLPVVLVTNDDGIGAPGLQALVFALVEGGRCDVHICAPDSDQSGVAQAITTRRTLYAESVDIAGAKAFQVSGTPADCVSLALSGAFAWPPPALVISGINQGSNTGYHIIYSGTVAGAREGFINGVPAIALSLHWVKGESTRGDFKAAADVSLPLIYAMLRDIKQGIHLKSCFYNVDIPIHPAQHKGYKVTKQGSSRMASTWKSVTNQRRSAVAKENAIGIQLAQLGLAASAAGARRQTSSARSTPVEIESMGAAETQNSDAQRLAFKFETTEMEYGQTGDDLDFGALQQGFITVTPLGLVTSVEPEMQASAISWVSSIVEPAVPSAL